MTVRDFKGRLYRLIEVSHKGTLLEKIDDGSRVRIRNNSWFEIGFIAP